MTEQDLPLVWYATDQPDEALMSRLTEAPAQVAMCGLLAAPPDGDAVVIDAAGDPVSALRMCRAVRHRQSDETSILMLTPEEPSLRLPAYQAGADVCLGRPFAMDELLAQLRASLRWTTNQRRHHDRAGQAREANRELQQAYAQMASDAEFAGRLQASFTPLFPEIGRVRFAVHYQAHGAVGSDCCDAIQLDERHVGFWLADAMCHGVPAALLTAFLRRAIVGKEAGPCGYQIVAPADVLYRLNSDLLALGLADPPLATMLYGVVDTIEGSLTLSRAAHPSPMIAAIDAAPAVWSIPGTLLGMPGANFVSETRPLGSGDRLIMFTDGMCCDPTAAVHPELHQAVCDTQQTPWSSFAEAVTRRVVAGRSLTDDATLFALEFQAD